MVLLLALLTGLSVISPVCAADEPADEPGDAAKPKRKLRAVVAERIDGIFDQLESTSNFEVAQTKADELFDQVIAHAPASQVKAMTEAAWAVRLIGQLADTNVPDRIELLRFLRARPKLAHTLSFLIKPEEEPGPIYALLDQLGRQRGARLERYASLTAAICVVHDLPLHRSINENRTEAPPPIELFDYFVKNENRMLHGVRKVPAELLVFVVDSTVSIAEMRWALRRYEGDRQVGRRFFDIAYDYDHFRLGKPKRVTQAGFSLPNILEHGGICADQAYFAMAVGKSIGVPTTYTVGRGADLSHAWVGFLQAKDNRALWNFDTGRYRVYRGVRGNVQDPQTRQAVADSSISLLAELVTAPPSDRHAAAAYIDAAERLAVLGDRSEPLAPDPLPDVDPAKLRDERRSAGIEAELQLIESGLRRCPGYERGWLAMARRAAAGSLTIQQKQRWADVLDRLCAQRYPDFTLAVLEPMVASISDPAAQSQLWDRLFARFARRPDLAARVRMIQGELWEQQGQVKRAARCYEDVIARLANDGPFVIEALAQIERLLRQADKADKVVSLYAQVWPRIDKPRSMPAAFANQSNWYRVGMTYADKLAEAGQQRRAEAVRNTVTKSTQAGPPSRSGR